MLNRLTKTTRQYISKKFQIGYNREARPMNCILHLNIFIYLLDWNLDIVDWIRTCLSTKSPNLTFWKTDYPGSFFNSLMGRSQRHPWIEKSFRKIILHFIGSRSACHMSNEVNHCPRTKEPCKRHALFIDKFTSLVWVQLSSISNGPYMVLAWEGGCVQV